MRIFKTRWFARFSKAEKITDKLLAVAIANAERGLVDADLGGGLIKLRIARPGAGKSGGWRTVIAYRRGQRAVFVFGFAKSDLNNITPDQLASFKTIAAGLLTASDEIIAAELEQHRLKEVQYGENEKD